jgi:hypothetical protein
LSQVSNEAVRYDSQGGSSIGVSSFPQTFRYGYMGHAIIICQALVHACTNSQSEPDDDDQTRQSEDGTRSVRSTDRLAGIKRSTSSVASRNTNDSVSISRGEDESMEKEPLFLAEMVRYHPLSDRWDDFVHTTLSAETAVQSTPLGGYGGASGGDPVLARRPGLADDGDLSTDSQPAFPGRGLLGELDMDDNDLDIAANMMAALRMGRGQALDEDDDDNFSGSGDSNRSYNSGETNHSGGYLFDDPLGKDSTGLGIELGKLTKLKSDLLDAQEARAEDNDGDGDDSSKSSSEEGSPEDDGAPVLDLFAGNFSYEQPSGYPVPNSGAGEFDFANFDDAFAQGPSGSDDEFGAFVHAQASTSNVPADMFKSELAVLLLETDATVSAQESASLEAIDAAAEAAPQPVADIADDAPGISTAPSDELMADEELSLRLRL